MKKYLLSFLAIVMMIATTIQAQIPTKGLVAYYPFSGNANDSSGNGNNGTVNAATLTTDRFGKANSAYNFNGGAATKIVVDSIKPIIVSDRSYSFWLKYPVNPTNYYTTILNSDNFCGCDYFAILGDHPTYIQNNQVGMLYDGKSGLSSTTHFNDNKWHHCVLIDNYSKSKSILYVDGKFNNIDSSNNFSKFNQLVSFAIGNTPVGNAQSAFQGSLDDIRLYNRILDSVDVQTLYHEGGFDTPLPLHLTTFTATYQNKQSVLHWLSTNETNTTTFTIERRCNGSSFSQVGEVTAKGSGNNNYGFTDAYTGEDGILYYRLKMIDKDGSFSYSKVVNINFGNSKSFSIVPNPAKDFATINFNKTVVKAKIEVYDITGKQVITQLLSGSTSTYKLNTQFLKSGLYVIKVNTTTGNYNEKLLINK